MIYLCLYVYIYKLNKKYEMIQRELLGGEEIDGMEKGGEEGGSKD